MVLSHALGCSPHPLVSVSGTVARTPGQGLFLEAWNQPCAFGSRESRLTLITLGRCRTVCVIRLQARPLAGLNDHLQAADLSVSVPPDRIVFMAVQEY